VRERETERESERANERAIEREKEMHTVVGAEAAGVWR
jgi:hypothetical protein